MRISTKGRYALEAVVDLHLHSGNIHESMKNICERQKLSENYLEQIFMSLKRQGIVGSVRGATGGYYLAREARLITAWDVISAVEGDLSLVDCLSVEGKGRQCSRASCCVTRNVWEKVTETIRSTLESTTVADLALCYKKMQEGLLSQYSI
ncbi:MAG: RrF2 family transcriptional regulator [Clostridia bacterium]